MNKRSNKRWKARRAFTQLTPERLEPRRMLANVPAGYTETVLAANLTSPTTLDIEENGRIWLAYQDGRIEVIEPGQPSSTLAIQLDADGSAEHGLQGIELDPNFEENNYLYVYYTANSPSPHNRLSRLTVDPTTENTILADSEVPLVELPPLSNYGNPPWHIGGAIHFGLDGESIFVQIGEMQQAVESQNLESELGKVFRVNRADGSPLPDNPYYDASDGITWRDYIWATGLRNPFAGDLNPVTGQYLIADVGAGSWEEINDATEPGQNFGWPVTEGDFNQQTHPDFSRPLHAYSHGNGCAITGGAFNTGGVLPFPEEQDGRYFFSEFCRGEIRSVDPDNPADVQVFATDAAFPMNIEFGPDGAMYYISRGAGAGGAPGIETGSVRRIAFAAEVAPAIVLPPNDQLASVGEDAVFEVSAAGTEPITYQWQVDDGSGFVDIAGAQGSTLVLNEVSTAQNGFAYRAVATNELGVATSAAATLAVTTDTRPEPFITLPAPGSNYRAGDTIAFSGGAADTEDGELSVDALTWRVDFHHNTHSHPFIPPTSGLDGAEFTIPTKTETDDDVWFRITLTATDSAGLASTTFRDVLPLKSDFVVETNMPGGAGALLVDGKAVDGPFNDTGVENVERTIEVPSTLAIDGEIGFFEQWIDGSTGLARTISTPEDDTAFVALYRTVSGVPIYLSDLPTSEPPINGWGPLELDMSNGETAPGDGNPITLNGVVYEKGLGVHAYSEVTYNLGGAYTQFISDIGLDDENAPGGTVEFLVLADDQAVFDSGLMTNASDTQTVSVDVTGVSELKLIVTTAGDGNGHDHADWADARLLATDSEPIVQINFQAETARVPTGYLADSGEIYGERQDGWQYGWSSDHTDLSRDRNINANQVLDTLVHFHEGQTWELDLPNGEYLVTASVGDAGFDSFHTLNVEGRNYFDALPLGPNQFASQSQLVIVSDGRLTLDMGDAVEKSTRLNFVTVANVTGDSSLLPYGSADATLDSRLDERDVAAVIRGWQADTTGMTRAGQVGAGDFDFDGVVDDADWALLSAAWNAQHGVALDLDAALATAGGDFDNNGVVDDDDHAAWIDAFGDELDLAVSGALLPADGNFDGRVDAADYTLWRDQLAAPPATITEPVAAQQAVGVALNALFWRNDDPGRTGIEDGAAVSAATLGTDWATLRKAWDQLAILTRAGGTSEAEYESDVVVESHIDEAFAAEPNGLDLGLEHGEP